MKSFIVPIAVGLFALAAVALAPATAQAQTVATDDALITSLYQRYLGRNPEAAGLQGWLKELRRGRNVEAAILGSDEYLTRQGSTADGFVKGLYVDVLKRQPRADEVQGWLVRLQQDGNDREVLAGEFLVAAQTELATRTEVLPPPLLPPPTTSQPPPPVVVPEVRVYRSILPLPLFGFRFGWWR